MTGSFWKRKECDNCKPYFIKDKGVGGICSHPENDSGFDFPPPDDFNDGGCWINNIEEIVICPLKTKPFNFNVLDGKAEHRATYAPTKFGMGAFPEKMILCHHLDFVMKELKGLNINKDKKERMLNSLKEVKASVTERIL